MCSPVSGSVGGTLCAVFVAASLITMLVVGILGANGSISMAPIGARFLIGIPIAFTVGALVAAAKVCCSKKSDD